MDLYVCASLHCRETGGGVGPLHCKLEVREQKKQMAFPVATKRIISNSLVFNLKGEFHGSAHARILSGLCRHSGKMTAHARLFWRLSSRVMCEWTLEEGNEASFSPNLTPSVDGNRF